MQIEGTWFKDDEGRTLILRGVNLGGSSKVPFQPNGATHIREGFYNHRVVSFVGRPFPLEEADEHFARLRSWGLTFLRFLVTWEAVEHAGPESGPIPVKKMDDKEAMRRFATFLLESQVVELNDAAQLSIVDDPEPRLPIASLAES